MVKRRSTTAAMIKNDDHPTETSFGATPDGGRKVEEFAEGLGQLLGTARAQAERWIGQRTAMVQHLEGIRDTAIGLLNQLTGSSAQPPRRGGRRSEGTGRSGSGAPSSGNKAPRKRRKLSTEARAKIAEAQRRRWAKHKAANK